MDLAKKILKIGRHPALLLCMLALLILLWVYTGVSKAIENDKFIFQIGQSPFFLLARYKHLIGIVIPITELLIAGLLFSGGYRKVGLQMSLMLLIAFEVYIAGMVFWGGTLPCACGGVISFMSWRIHLLFNLIFVAISILLLKAEYPRVRKRE